MLNASEVPVPMEEARSIKKTDIDNVLSDIKNMLGNEEKVSDKLLQYIGDVEAKIVEERKLELNSVDRMEIKELVMKHPYFKNPSTYHIRMITIMKYLRKKGIDITLLDFDLLVDDIITSIDGVEKIGYGKYRKKRF